MPLSRAPSLVLLVVVLVVVVRELRVVEVADRPQVGVRDAHALPVGADIVLDSVLLEERAHAVADLRVVVLRRGGTGGSEAAGAGEGEGDG